jgi:hypothetical protein
MMASARLYRRRVIGEARAFETRTAMEDDFHHFTLRLIHDGRRVTDLVAESVRFPWSTCPAAGERLTELVGTILDPGAAGPKPAHDISRHCTHLFDLAKFAVAQTLRGGRRRYDIVIPDRIGGRTEARIARDGAPVFRWTVEGAAVTAPPDFAGHALSGRAIWPDGSIADADSLEAALMLRRALMIFRGRMSEFPAITRADQVLDARGTCFTYQPENAPSGLRSIDEQDFTDRPEAILADFEARFGGALIPLGPTFSHGPAD